jgi:hypothetical protein
MPDKTIDPSRPAPQQNLQEDGITNPKDGRGPLRKSDDSSTKLPLRTDAPKQSRAH